MELVSGNPMQLASPKENAHVVVETCINTVTPQSIETATTDYLIEIDRKLSDIENCLGNRRYDSVLTALLNTTSNFKNMHQAVSTLSRVVKQQHTQIHEYRSQLHDCKDKILTLGGLNNAIILELSTRNMEMRTEQAMRLRLESELADCQSKIHVLTLANEKSKTRENSPESIPILSEEDSVCCKDDSYHDKYSMTPSLTAVISPIPTPSSQDESISKTLFFNDDNKVSILRKENIELQATNKALVTTISHQETRLKKELIRQQKLESLVQALQSQLQEMKETRELEDQLKYALLTEMTGDYNNQECNHLSKSWISLDPCLSLEEKIRILENALVEERNNAVGLRQQLDTATRYLQVVTCDQNQEGIQTPSKIAYHRTVFMKSMLPTSKNVQERSSEKSRNDSFTD